MESVWEAAANKLTWEKKWDTVLDASDPCSTKWFVGGKISFCYNAIDIHANGVSAGKTAIIYEFPSHNIVRKVTYQELKECVSMMAGALVNHGVQKGDIVMAFLPNILEGAFLYLASSRIGAITCYTTHGTAVAALTNRIDTLKPKLLITTSYSVSSNTEINYKATFDEALSKCNHQPAYCVVIQREFFKPAHLTRPRDITWDEFIQKAERKDCVAVESNHPLFICYTSGSTSSGKAHVYTTGGVCTSSKYFVDHVLGDTDIWFPNASLGWVIGINVSISGTLLLGKTTGLLEGDALSPNIGNYFRVVTQHNIDVWCLSTATLTAIAKNDPDGIFAEKYGVKGKVKIIHAGGHMMPEEAKDYVWKFLGPNTILSSGYGQTEVGTYIAISSVPIQYDKEFPSTFVGLPIPEFNITIVDDDGNILEHGNVGNLVFKLPLPPGSTSGIFNEPEKFKNDYFAKFKGYFETKDIGMFLPDGTLCVHGRTDGFVKLGLTGIRLNLTEVENIITANPKVNDVAVVCMKHATHSVVPVAFYTTAEDCDIPTKIQFSKELAKEVENNIGALYKFQYAFQVKAIPKTAVSGKTASGAIGEFVKRNFPLISEDSSYDENWELLNNTLASFSYVNQ